ncbi:hypothetical protein ADL27_11125 [Streptomyces sp. NRRL F-6602]|nr:hypothetical protein ADL27_11125 [Streptomyces sp. NRRL F-6602]
MGGVRAVSRRGGGPARGGGPRPAPRTSPTLPRAGGADPVAIRDCPPPCDGRTGRGAESGRRAPHRRTVRTPGRRHTAGRPRSQPGDRLSPVPVNGVPSASPGSTLVCAVTAAERG